MTAHNIQEILTDHKLWLEGKGGKRADLYSADLRGANLRDADLINADLRKADLRKADLRSANLISADLRSANLSNADLRRADLYLANLLGADLRRADLRNADLGHANLLGANLQDITMCWQSHDLIAEILRQAAEESRAHRSLAGLVLVSRDWCWDRFVEELAGDDKAWCRSVLEPRIKEGDDVPFMRVPVQGRPAPEGRGA